MMAVSSKDHFQVTEVPLSVPPTATCITAPPTAVTTAPTATCIRAG